MKTINQVIDTFQQSQAASAQPRQSSEGSQPGQQKITSKAIETLWDKMSAMFGHRWTASFGEKTDPDQVWFRCLQDLTGKDIANGLSAVALSGMEWPPTAPQFRDMCIHHNVSNLLDADQAYAELVRFVRGGGRSYELLSPETYFTYRNMDVWNWRTLSAEKAEKVFKSAFKSTIQHAKNGGEFPPVPTAAISREMPKPSGVVSESGRARAKQIMGDLLKMMKA